MFDTPVETLLNTIIFPYGMRIIAALIILIVGNWLAKWAASLFVAVMTRYEIELTLTRFLRNIVYYGLLAAVVIAAASKLGINTASFLTVVGAAGLAVGLALKDSLANFSSGAMLILLKPFKVGDWVSVASETGKVEEINIVSTIINTGDNQRKIIPNSRIANDTITNITANPIRRIDLSVGVGYDDDLREAERILRQVVADEARILAEPAPVIAVAELGDSSVNFIIRPWVKTAELWDVRFALTKRIKLAFDEAGITIPYPQHDVHLHQKKERSDLKSRSTA